MQLMTILHIMSMILYVYTPLRAPGYCGTLGRQAPLTLSLSTIFHGSFSNLARTFITLRSRTSSIMEVLPL